MNGFHLQAVAGLLQRQSACNQTRWSGIVARFQGAHHSCSQHHGAQVKAKALRPDHPIVRANQRLREELLPPEDGEPQHEKGLFAAKVRMCHHAASCLVGAGAGAEGRCITQKSRGLGICIAGQRCIHRCMSEPDQAVTELIRAQIGCQDE